MTRIITDLLLIRDKFSSADGYKYNFVSPVQSFRVLIFVRKSEISKV